MEQGSNPSWQASLLTVRRKISDVANGSSFCLDLPALGAQGGALRLEVGQGRGFALPLVSKCPAGLTLPFHGRERSVGLAPLGGLLDRDIHLVEPAIEIGDVVGCHLDLGGNGCVLRLDLGCMAPRSPT